MRRCLRVLLVLGLLLASASLTRAQDGDPLARARRLNARALQHFEHGQHRAGLAPARQALSIRENALGANHLDVAESLQTLGDLLAEMADYVAARPLLERALAIREHALGPRHELVAETLTTLGDVRYRAAEFPAARALLERALAIRERSPGPDRTGLATTLDELGRVLRAFHQGLANTGRAAALQQAQIAILRHSATAHPYFWAPFILIGAR